MKSAASRPASGKRAVNSVALAWPIAENGHQRPSYRPEEKILPLVCPKRVLGQIEIGEVPDFVGAPEEIRTPDPKFVVWC